MKNIFKLIIVILLFPIYVFAYSDYVIPGGDNVGIKLNIKGVMIIGFYSVDNTYNENNLNVGTYITKVEDNPVNTIEDLIYYINKYNKDGIVNITTLYNNKEKEIKFKLHKDNNIYKTGLYVKDKIVGIGTLTYIDPSTNIYGALGHEIIESTTNKNVLIEDGVIVDSKVTGITRSYDGTPGTKNATITENKKGIINKNTNVGIYGIYENKNEEELIQVGKINELKKGKAYIRTVINNKMIDDYEINITKIDKNSKTKNIYFEITDERLLDKTGGIIQGMSGSPIIQDNKLFGAVTHVVVDNVKKGYGISIITMLEKGEE